MIIYSDLIICELFVVLFDHGILADSSKQMLRRLAQNREAARKSRLRKKVSVVLLYYIF